VAHGLASYADAVAVCAEQERLVPACLVGHSFGGAVALEVALRRPELVSSLVLAAAAGISSSTLRARAGLRTLGALRPSLLAARYRTQVARRPLLKRLVFAGLAADPDVLSPEAVHGFLQGSSALSEGRTAVDVLLEHDPRPELHRLICPVLVLWGARDRFLPLADGHEYARRLGAPLRVLPDTGHLLISERPDDCAELIERFVDPTVARAASHGVRKVDELPVEVESAGDRPR
jgi:pimeloyl-ACP methyl ester carboxylesterase